MMMTPLADRLDFREDVRREQDVCPPASSRIVLKRLADLQRVEAGGRLVEDQDGRVVDHGVGQPDALPVALESVPINRRRTSRMRSAPRSRFWPLWRAATVRRLHAEGVPRGARSTWSVATSRDPQLRPVTSQASCAHPVRAWPQRVAGNLMIASDARVGLPGPVQATNDVRSRPRIVVNRTRCVI